MSFVSVIIPNYDHAAYLKIRIDSVLNQTYKDFEVIILDDCSADNSKDIIESYRSNKNVSHIVYNETNSGSTFKQWQKGIGLAKGKYIWIAESDDMSAAIFLETAVGAMEQVQNAALFFCQSNCIDFDGKPLEDMHWWTNSIKVFDWNKPFIENGNDFIKNALLNKNVIVNASAVLIRAGFINDHLKAIQNYTMCGDWLLWVLLLKDKEVIYSAEKMNFFRKHEQTTRNLFTKNKQLQRIAEEIAVKQQVGNFYELKNTMPHIKNSWGNLFNEVSPENFFFIKRLFKKLGIKPVKYYNFLFLLYSARHLFNNNIKRVKI